MLRVYSRRTACLFLALYLTSCAGKSDKNTTTIVATKDSTTQVYALPGSEENVPEENTVDSLLVNRDKQIAGTWNALDGQEDLTINVTADSIFYVEHSESHGYELKKDSIFIHYHDYILSGKPLLLKDTFAIIAEDHISKFSRTKN
jgi:hypothetical protein